MTETPPSNGQQDTAEQDRYPDIFEVLAAVADDIDAETVHVERVEVYCQANGDASYRYWEPRADESEGNYLPDLG